MACHSTPLYCWAALSVVFCERKNSVGRALQLDSSRATNLSGRHTSEATTRKSNDRQRANLLHFFSCFFSLIHFCAFVRPASTKSLALADTTLDLPLFSMACLPHDDRPVGPAPIDILPDDVLIHLVDTYLDDRSLGACLLAWRRFHVLDRRALFQRKYRWATLHCLCLAGDHDGLDYALEHLAVYGESDDLATTSSLVAMAGAGHVTMIERVVRMHDMEWPVDCKLWSSLVFALAKGGHGDALAWLCRADNRSHEWDEDAIATECRNIVGHAHGAEVIDRVLCTAEASGDSRATAQRRIWRLVATQQQPPSSSSSLPTTKQMAAAVHGVIELCNQVQNFASCGYDGICDMIREGHMGLLRDLVGPDMLISSLRHIRPRPPDPDDALWVYDNVDSCDRKRDGPFHLLHVASRTGRLDLLDRAEADLPLFSSRPGHAERAFARAYVHAGRLWSCSICRPRAHPRHRHADSKRVFCPVSSYSSCGGSAWQITAAHSPRLSRTCRGALGPTAARQCPAGRRGRPSRSHDCAHCARRAPHGRPCDGAVALAPTV